MLSLDPSILDLFGKIAYDAYCETRSWKSFKGDPLPQWEDSPEDIRAGWRTAGQAVLDCPIPTDVPSTPISPLDHEIISDKELRRDLDAQIQKVKSLPPSRERSLTITKLQEAVMWLGMDLKRLNDSNPYPDGKDPSNTRIQPVADGLKL
jgi:hypothetical protein